MGFIYAILYKDSGNLLEDAAFAGIAMGAWLSDVVASLCAGSIVFCVILFFIQRQAYDLQINSTNAFTDIFLNYNEIICIGSWYSLLLFQLYSLLCN